MYIFLPPVVIKQIHSILAKFLWKGTLTGHCMHKIAWEDCCYNKSEGGLGFKSLKNGMIQLFYFSCGGLSLELILSGILDLCS